MKKLIILFTILALGSISLHAQVAVNTDGSAPDAAAILHVKGSGNNNFFIDDANGFVGIRNLSPNALLDIPYSGSEEEMIIGDNISSWHSGAMLNIGANNAWSGLYVGQTASDKGFIFWENNTTPAAALFSIGTFNGANNLILQQQGGNVGIGTTNPTALLHVVGDVRFQGGLYDSNNDMGTSGQVLQTTGTGTDWVDASTFNDGDWTISGSNLYSTVSGNVGIGNTSPADKLTIGGGDILIGTDAISTANFTGLKFQYNAGSGEGAIMSSYDDGYGLLTFYTKSGGGNPITERMRISANGLVGIGTAAPTQLLHVNGTMRLSNALYDMNNSAGSAGQILSTTTTGVDWIDAPSGGGDADWTISGSNMYSAVSGNVGIGDASPTRKLDVYESSTDAAEVIYASRPYNNYGITRSTIYGYRYGFGGETNGGTGYGVSTTDVAVKGYSYYGNNYTFGVAGWNYNDYNRCGGTFGANSSGYYWGSLGYKASNNTTYGGYFTSTGSGAGKESDVQINNGIGAWGELFGADIHGKVYGAYIEGDNYATYTKGDNYTSGLDVHLQKEGNRNEVMYTNVSTDATIMTSGTANLNKGIANINFDANFSNIVSENEAIVVTVTPIGNSNGVYLNSVTKNGFEVKENNNGRSDVTVSYIAIGKRKGYENPQLASEVIAIDYESKLASGLHNDNDTETDGQGLYYENGELIVGIHPSTLPDPNKPKEEEMVNSTSMESNVTEVVEAVEVFGTEAEETDNMPQGFNIDEDSKTTISDPNYKNGVLIQEEVQEVPQEVKTPDPVPVKTLQPKKRKANPDSPTGGWN